MARKIRRAPGIVKPLSDKSKLLWERYYGPMQGAAQSLNAAIANTQNLLAVIIMEMEGVDPTMHTFDADNMRIIARPNVPPVALTPGGNHGKVE